MDAKPKVKVSFKEWDYTCGDGCCYEYGTTTTVNGVELDIQNSDTETIVEQILLHLGYDVEIENIYDEDE